MYDNIATEKKGTIFTDSVCRAMISFGKMERKVAKKK